jgi:hypothetical protein
MQVRGEAWRLLAEGVRTNNTALMNTAKQKQETGTNARQAIARRKQPGTVVPLRNQTFRRIFL